MEMNKISFKIQQEESHGVSSDKTFGFDIIMSLISDFFGIAPKVKDNPGVSDQINNISNQIEEINKKITKLEQEINSIKNQIKEGPECLLSRINTLDQTVQNINGKIGSIQLGEDIGYKDNVSIFVKLNEDINKQIPIWKDRKLADLIYRYIYVHSPESKAEVIAYIKDKDETTRNSVTNQIRDIENFYNNCYEKIANFLSKNEKKDFFKCIVNPCDRLFNPEIHDEGNYSILDSARCSENKETYNYVLKLGYDFPRSGKSKALVYTE